MTTRHLLLYMISRIFVAATNFVTIIAFSRLAGPENYGQYIIILTAAMVINGFAIQWVRYAFFARYRPEQDSELLFVFLSVGLLSLSISSIAALAFFAVTNVSKSFAVAALILGFSISIFDAGIELSRTRLAAGRVAVATITRSCLILVFGAAAFWFKGTAWSLALGVALANAIAFIPCALGVGNIGRFKFDKKIAMEFGIFGLPLIASFGIGNLAQGMDRFMLNYFDAASSVGLYSPVADTVRSGFFVFGEAISISMMSIAKQKHVAGEEAEAFLTLGAAYRSLLFLCVFGSVFCLVFGEDALRAIFPVLKNFDLSVLLPLVIGGAVLLIMRNSYFAQVIYFCGASYLELISALLLFAVNFGVGWFLISDYGIIGAATTFLAAQIATTVFYIVVGRQKFRLPAPLAPFLLFLAIGAALFAACAGIDALGLSYGFKIFAKLLCFSLATVWLAWLYDLGPSAALVWLSRKRARPPSDQVGSDPISPQ